MEQSSHRHVFFVMVVLVIMALTTDALDVTIQGDTSAVETLQCSSGTVIVPVSVFYGVVGTDCQLLTAIIPVLNDCFNNEECRVGFSSFEEPCSGADMSSVELNISYMCEEAANIVDICSPPAQLPDSFFLITPNFPKNYPKLKSCQLDIEGTEPITLTILFMSLNKRPPGSLGCYDYIYIEDPANIATKNQYCGSTVDPGIGINFNWPLEVTLDSIHLNFFTDPRKNEPGFLIRIGALEEGSCQPDPCDKGTCLPDGDTFKCVCDDGFGGELCDEPVDPCQDVTCGDHGTCEVDVSGAATCACDEGWEGDECDDEVDPCDGVTCVNGQCVDGVCECDDAWIGALCTEEVDPCEGVTCVNGQCVDGDCDCEDGWQGGLCDEEIPDACASVDCDHGTCDVDASGTATCSCDDGWEGDACDEEVDPCDGVSCDHGQCDDGVCDCEDGWQGDLCDEEIPDACASVDCDHGTCEVDASGTATCSCDDGWEGDACDEEVDPCEDVSCVNGQCVDGVCDCDDAWIGALCTEEVDPCADVSCVNGDCVDGDCKCQAGWDGELCDIEADSNDCDPDPCGVHTEWCEDDYQTFLCHCQLGWSGELCDVTTGEDQCNPNPCDKSHTERCEDDYQTFLCHCNEGWSGELCDVEISTGSAGSLYSFIHLLVTVIAFGVVLALC